MTSTWGRSQERNSFGTFKSLERNRLLVIAWQQHIFWKTTCGMVMWKQSRLSHQHVCYHPTSLRSGVILPGHSTLSSCHLVSGALLTAHVRQAQLLSSALAFALLRSDGTVATWGTLVLVQFHGDCLMVSELLSPWSCYGKKKNIAPWSWWFLPCGSRSLNTGCAGTPSEQLPNLKQYGLDLFLLMKMGSIMFNEVCPIASSSWNLSVSMFI